MQKMIWVVSIMQKRGMLLKGKKEIEKKHRNFEARNDEVVDERFENCNADYNALG